MKSAFIPYLVVGDPDLDTSRRMVDLLVEEGADALELGVPFSDALADGPVIQQASERASRTMDSVLKVLEFSAGVRKAYPDLPLILFTYFNPIFRLGLRPFARAAKASGITDVLVVDLPPEEAGEHRRILASEELKTVFLASPTSSPERLRLIAEASTGFIYYVSRTGVTGVRDSISGTLSDELSVLRKLTSKPIAVGFGISNAEQAGQVAALADAVVVGSALVRLISQPDSARREAQVRELARSMKQGISRASRK